ncbi:MAG: DUF4157 domain-containing protein [Chloroflexi bacterium]|nr:DUF4157 domain-containing protein [Chloroflexota bacterium]MDA1147361.1 DUF4157 domain-containing protein [Chloroflexota bacterium]
MPGQRLPEEVIARLVPVGVPEGELRAIRVVTRAPARWLPPIFHANAMTFGRYVLIRAGRYDPETTRGLALIAHEAGHVTQWRKLGVARFFVRYARGLIRARFAHARHPMEQPLNQRQREVRAALDAEEPRTL